MPSTPGPQNSSQIRMLAATAANDAKRKMRALSTTCSGWPPGDFEGIRGEQRKERIGGIVAKFFGEGQQALIETG